MEAEITAKIRRAYEVARRPDGMQSFTLGILAAALRDQLARAEFWSKHHETLHGSCAGCPASHDVSDKHEWAWPDWQAEAERKLTEG